VTSEPPDPGEPDGDAVARVRTVLEQDQATAALGIEVLATPAPRPTNGGPG
jgi:hypothetical protein